MFEHIFFIQERSNFEMSTAAIFQCNSALPCAQFLADGSLRLIQNNPLPPHGSDDYSLNDPLININASDIKDYSISTLTANLATRKGKTADNALFTHINWRIRCAN